MTFRLLRMAVPLRGRLALAALAGFGTLASGVGLLATSGYLISRAASRPPVLELTVAITAVSALALSRAGLRYTERLVSHDLALRLLARVRVGCYRLLRPLAPAGLEVFRSPDLLQRLVGDVEALQDFFLRVATPPLACTLVALVAVGLLWQLMPAAAVVLALGLLLAGVGLTWLASRLSRRSAAELAGRRAELAVRLVDLLQGAADVVAFGHGPGRLRALAETDRALSRLGTRLAATSAAVQGSVVATSGLTAAAVLAVAVSGVSTGRVDGVLLATIALVALAAFEAIQPLPEALQKLQESASSAHRLRDLEDAPAPVTDPPRPIPVRSGALVIEDGWLRYRPEGPARHRARCLPDAAG